MHGTSGSSDCELDYSLEIGAWHLLEVQWDKDQNAGIPMWYLSEGTQIPVIVTAP